MVNRDFSINPYSKDELRIVHFLHKRGCGGGDDPIGFLIAAYGLAVSQRNEALAELHLATAGAKLVPHSTTLQVDGNT